MNANELYGTYGPNNNQNWQAIKNYTLRPKKTTEKSCHTQVSDTIVLRNGHTIKIR